jgi:hypothetical protein
MKNVLFLMVLWLIGVSPALAWWHDDFDHDWDYHGSGRDRPYSEYIDQRYYVGYADYAPIRPDYVDTDELLLPPAPQKEFTVNVPNDHGGYTTVLIKRSGNGFVGPQGEYYPEFPKISQLKLMYGK